MKSSKQIKQNGAVNAQLVVIISLLVVVVGLSGLSAWLYTKYDEQKNDTDSLIGVAVAEARKEQAEANEEVVRAIEEEPNLEFAGPEEYGRLSFKYPKNWSVYVADDTSTSNKFNAYLHPVTVPPINSASTRFAVVVNIETIAYDKALDKYRNDIEKGEIKSSPVTVNGHEGTRLDGSIARDIRGSAVLFRVRDKTITISSQADTFKSYFDNIIKTVEFND